MSIALPALFALTGLFSIVAIWHAVSANLPAMRLLRQQVMMPGYASDVIVNFREPATEFDALSAVRRPRQVRVPAPKPVTHRLHHFAKSRTAA